MALLSLPLQAPAPVFSTPVIAGPRRIGGVHKQEKKLATEGSGKLSGVGGSAGTALNARPARPSTLLTLALVSVFSTPASAWKGMSLSGHMGINGFALVPLLAAPYAAAYDDPYNPSCATAPPLVLTLQGDSTGPWEDAAWLSNHGGDEIVGAAYANVPPMSLLSGDKLAFDTSVLGTGAMNVTVSLASCVPTRTDLGDNAEEGLTYTCEETLMPEHKVRRLTFPSCYPAAARARALPPACAALASCSSAAFTDFCLVLLCAAVRGF